MHLYSYFGLSKHLSEGILKGASFFPSQKNYTPLTITIDKKFSDCIDSIIDSLKSRSIGDPLALYYISSSLSALNSLSYAKLHEIYNISFGKSFAVPMPKFCEDTVDLPVIVNSKKYFVYPDKFIEHSKFKYEEVAVEFFQTFVKINTKLGSFDSLEFMRTLVQCNNLEVFKTGFVKIILDYKWKSLLWLHVFEVLLYFTYLIVLARYSVTLEQANSLIISFIINILLLLFEILQMATAGWGYFKSF